MIMFGKSRRTRRKKITFIQRFFRSIVAIVILSAFILGISLMVKEMAGLDPYGVVKLAGPILDKIGISTEEAGQVAGTFAERMLKTNIAPSVSYKEDLSGSGDGNGASTTRSVVFKAVMMGDSANDNTGLASALSLAEKVGANRVFYLGDYTNLGVKSNLEAAKAVMDASGLLYYSLPGDRDADINAEPVANFENYFDVFGNPRVSVTIGDIKFALLNNSANYTLIDSEYLGQFYNELNGADYVILSQPLYHPLNTIGKPIMGVVNGEIVPNVKAQADEILSKIRESNVRVIVAGDQHSFAKIPDSEKEGLTHVYIGPIAKERADRGIASITLLSIYDDASYSVEELFLD